MQFYPNRLSTTPQDQSPHSNSNATNQSTRLRTGEGKILSNLVQGVKLMKELLCQLNKIPYHPEAGMNKDEQSNKLIILRLILTHIAVSRLFMNVLITELNECETGIQLIDVKETWTSLVIAGIFLSREGNKTLETVRNDGVGKKQIFLKRALFGTGFMSIQHDAGVQWIASEKRSPRTSEVEDRELRLGFFSKRDHPLLPGPVTWKSDRNQIGSQYHFML